MPQYDIRNRQFNNYGISTTKSGITKIPSSGTGVAGLLTSLRDDMIANWQLYNGEPVVGNEIILSSLDGSQPTFVTKRFFRELDVTQPSLDQSTTLGYLGSANYGKGPIKKQHVLLLESDIDILPNRGSVSRGVDQTYRVRLEYDERDRIHPYDKEFEEIRYQVNISLRSLSRTPYVNGSVIDETDTNYHLLEPLTRDLDGALIHPGYTLKTNSWEESDGIPNPMYGWLKTHVATSNQILNNGDVTEPITGSDGLILLENGSTLNTNVIRYPGECVDITFEDIIIPASSLEVEHIDASKIFISSETIVGESSGARAIYHPSSSGTTINFISTNEVPFQIDEKITGLSSGKEVYLRSMSTGISRSKRFRNKRKGNGWFKRFPKVGVSVEGSYPITYRLTMTERGFVFYLYDDAATDQNDDYAWLCVQRTVDNQTGITRTDEAGRFPVHVLYSCSRESVDSRDFGVYFSENAANLQTAENTVTEVFDNSGNVLDLDAVSNEKSFYILSPYDREDPLSDEFSAKLIWRFVAREFDILKPWDVHKLATKHQVDSNAIVNPLEQLSITDDNRFVITFPTGLTTQRFMYPKEEIDLICFSSAEVVAEGSNVPMTTYLPTGSTGLNDNRRYQGMRSTLPNGNGMRVMVLVNARYIFNSDVNLDLNLLD